MAVMAYVLADKTGVIKQGAKGTAGAAWKRLDAIVAGKAVTETHLEQFLRAIVFGPGAQDLGPSTQHHPPQPGPVFVVSINHNRDHRVALDIAEALEGRSSHALRLLVDRNVEGAL